MRALRRAGLLREPGRCDSGVTHARALVPAYGFFLTEEGLARCRAAG